MRWLRSCGIAISMYSRIPVPQFPWNQADMEYIFCWFPLVGVAVGGITALWLWAAGYLGLSAVFTAAGCVLLPILVTGGIHLDGLCDTADALASNGDREKKLEILKDTHVGAFAGITCGVYLLVQFAAWFEAITNSIAWGVVVCIPVLSRTLSGLAAVTWRNARGGGLLATFTDASSKRPVRVVLALWLAACAAALLWADLQMGALVLSGAALCFCYYNWMSEKKFGGITGDLEGWFLQLCELSCLLAVALLGGLVAG